MTLWINLITVFSTLISSKKPDWWKCIHFFCQRRLKFQISVHLDKVENTNDHLPKFNKGVRDLNTAFLGGYLWEKGNKFEILQY